MPADDDLFAGENVCGSEDSLIGFESLQFS